jgi:alpha-L-fucosidase
VAEYLEAFRAEGIVAGLYFSMLDLHHDIRRCGCTVEGKRLVLRQLTELLTGYGEIPFLIIDGWNANWGGPLYEWISFEEIDALVKALQPGCLLMNISCEPNLNHTDVVFFECAAGQQMEQGFNGPGIGCNYLTKQWFWREEDTSMTLRSAEWAVETVHAMNRRNAAFLLNVSPNTHGELDENVLSRLKEIGKVYHKLPEMETIPSDWVFREA